MDMETTKNATNGAEEKSANADRAPVGQRIRQVFDFLQRERGGGPELIFTMEHAEQLKRELGMRVSVSYGALERLQSKGLITKKPLQKGKGLLITFIGRSKDPKAVANSKPSIERIRDVVEYDIIGLEAQIAAKKKFLADLDSYAKSSAYAKLTEKKEAQ
jgi:hypothetical protein